MTGKWFVMFAVGLALIFVSAIGADLVTTEKEWALGIRSVLVPFTPLFYVGALVGFGVFAFSLFWDLGMDKPARILLAFMAIPTLWALILLLESLGVLAVSGHHVWIIPVTLLTIAIGFGLAYLALKAKSKREG
jgi:hypothetical protein